MECNNKYCLWCMDNKYCVSESLGDVNVRGWFEPNQLDCPMSLRSDFEIMLRHMANSLAYLGMDKTIIGSMTFKQMDSVLKLISKLGVKDVV